MTALISLEIKAVYISKNKIKRLLFSGAEDGVDERTALSTHRRGIKRRV